MDQNLRKVYTIVKNAIVLLSQKNKLTYFTGKDCLDKFFDHLIQHIKQKQNLILILILMSTKVILKIQSV